MTKLNELPHSAVYPYTVGLIIGALKTRDYMLPDDKKFIERVREILADLEEYEKEKDKERNAYFNR